MKKPSRFIGIAEVARRTSLGRATIWREQRAGTFPRSIKLTSAGPKGRRAWLESDIDQWMEARIEEGSHEWQNGASKLHGMTSPT